MVTLNGIIIPNFPGIEKLTKTVTTGSINAAANSTTTSTWSGKDANLFILNSKVSTSTSNARVEIVNGGLNTVTVKAYNDDVGAQTVTYTITVYAVRTS